MTLTIAHLEEQTTSTPPAGPAPTSLPGRQGNRRATCNHPIWGEPGGLTCIREPGHEPGHVYRDQHGSDVDDRHTDGGHG